MRTITDGIPRKIFLWQILFFRFYRAFFLFYEYFFSFVRIFLALLHILLEKQSFLEQRKCISIRMKIHLAITLPIVIPIRYNGNSWRQLLDKNRSNFPVLFFPKISHWEMVPMKFLMLLFVFFCVPGKESIAFCMPTFGMYRVVADMNDVSSLALPLDSSFNLDVPRILDEAKHAKFFSLFPNNPTGNSMSAERIEEILQQFSGIVVLDEAYIDFCPEKKGFATSFRISSSCHYPNIFKSMGMAGVRLGMCFRHQK